MSKKLVLLLLVFVVGVIFYFSWLPDPSFKDETYLPQWLLNWSNHNHNLRTAIPFLAIGFLLEGYSRHFSKKSINKNLNFMQNIGIVAIIVLIAEGGQFLIQKRSQDLMDVFYGIIGSLMGALVYHLFYQINKKLRNAK